MDLISFWSIIPNEIKLVLMTALPGVGKGIFLVPCGMLFMGFSMEKTVFLCSLGSAIKVGYYFCIVYGVEKYLLKKGFWIVKWCKEEIEKARTRHQSLYQCVGIMSLAIIPNIGPGISTGACLSYICGVGIIRGMLVTVSGTTLTTYIIALGVQYSGFGP